MHVVDSVVVDIDVIVVVVDFDVVDVIVVVVDGNAKEPSAGKSNNNKTVK